MTRWTVQYVDRRDDKGLHTTTVEADSFDEAWRSLESDDVCCVKSCTSLGIGRLIDRLTGTVEPGTIGPSDQTEGSAK